MSPASSTTPLRGLGPLFLFLSVATAAPVGAQAVPAQSQEPPARLQGVVVLESTFEPIADAVVSLVGTDLEARTGPMGEFAFPETPDGVLWVRVAAPGMPAVREQVEITGPGIVYLQFRMPDDVAALLDNVLVDVQGRTVETIEAASALDLLAQKVPSIKARSSGNVGDNSAAVRLRGFNSLTQNGDPLVVIDNVIAQGAPPLEILSRIPAADVESIEILRGPAASFRYPLASNGVIRVKTRRS